MCAFVTYKDIFMYVHLSHVYILVCVNIWRQTNTSSCVTCVHTGICQDEDRLVETPTRVATISRHLKIVGLFCKRALQKRLYSAKETYNFKEPTNRSHLLLCNVWVRVCMCMLLGLFWWCLHRPHSKALVCLCVCVCVCVREREREREREKMCIQFCAPIACNHLRKSSPHVGWGGFGS